MKSLLSFVLLSFLFIPLSAQEIIPLYPEGIKNFKSSDEKETRTVENILWIRKIQKPTLEIYLPPLASNSGKAVVICPGGGYEGLAYDWEGTEIAKWLNSQGIAAFVLKYRLPNSESVQEGRLVPLQDVQRAMRIVRSNAKEWHLNTNEIGVMGFSAGGHLASTLGTHYDFNDEQFFDSNSIDSVSARPDFMVLMYPVITMDKTFTHMGSRNSLLGDNPSQELVDFYSNELQVTENTPPTFIVHSGDDDIVPIKNAIVMFNALIEKGVSTEMHIYPYGGHGYSLAIDRGRLSTWPELLSAWFKTLD